MVTNSFCQLCKIRESKTTDTFAGVRLHTDHSAAPDPLPSTSFNTGLNEAVKQVHLINTNVLCLGTYSYFLCDKIGTKHSVCQPWGLCGKSAHLDLSCTLNVMGF